MLTPESPIQLRRGGRSARGYENNFNIARNERELHRIASRRESADSLENLLLCFRINRDRQDQIRGSSASHPMTARGSDALTHAKPEQCAQSKEDEDMCPLELDNQTWDYGFMCSGSYPSLAYYQRRARELTRYEEKEAAIKRAHQRHCVQRSDSSDSQTSVASMQSSCSD